MTSDSKMTPQLNIVIGAPDKDASSSSLSSNPSSGTSSPRRIPKPLGHSREPRSFDLGGGNGGGNGGGDGGDVSVGSTGSARRKLKRPFSATSRIGWLASLEMDDEPNTIRKTGIICTIGTL